MPIKAMKMPKACFLLIGAILAHFVMVASMALSWFFQRSAYADASPKMDILLIAVMISLIACLSVILLRAIKSFHANTQQALLGGLASATAHNVNNILSMINGHANLLEVAIQRGGDTATHIAQIKKSIQQGVKLTGRLADLKEACACNDMNGLTRCEDFKEFLSKEDEGRYVSRNQ